MIGAEGIPKVIDRQGRIVRQFADFYNGRLIWISPDASYVLAFGSELTGSFLRRFDVASGLMRWSISLTNNMPIDAVEVEGGKVFLRSIGHSGTLVNPGNGAVQTIRAQVYDPYNRHLIGLDFNGRIQKFSPLTGQVVASGYVLDPFASLIGVVSSYDGPALVLQYSTFQFLIVRLSSFALLKTVNLPVSTSEHAVMTRPGNDNFVWTYAVRESYYTHYKIATLNSSLVETQSSTHTLESGVGFAKFVPYGLSLERVIFGSREQTINAYKNKVGILPLSEPFNAERFPGHLSAVLDTSFSPSDSVVASAGFDSQVILWHTTTGKVLRTLPSVEPLGQVVWSSDGSLVAACNGFHRTSLDSGELVVWEASTGTEIARITNPSDRFHGIALDPSSNSVWASDSETIRKYAIPSGTLLFQRSVLRGGELAISADGRKLVVTNAKGDTSLPAFVLDTLTLEMTPITSVPGTMRTVAISQDGTVCFIAGGHTGAPSPIYKVQPSTGVLMSVLHGHQSNVSSLVLNNFGDLLSGAADKTIRAWDASTGFCTRVIDSNVGGRVDNPEDGGPFYGALGLSISHDGTKLAFGREDSTMSVAKFQSRQAMLPNLTGQVVVGTGSSLNPANIQYADDSFWEVSADTNILASVLRVSAGPSSNTYSKARLVMECRVTVSPCIVMTYLRNPNTGHLRAAGGAVVTATEKRYDMPWTSTNGMSAGNGSLEYEVVTMPVNDEVPYLSGWSTQFDMLGAVVTP